MTRYEVLDRKVASLNSASRRCNLRGNRSMALIWAEKAMILWLIQQDMTVEEGASNA